MSLAIRKFVTRCHASRRRASAAALVDRVIRERFASELTQYLGPSLSASAEVVRIRRLAVRVPIPAAEFGEHELLRALLEAFGRALFEALAYPPGVGAVEKVKAAGRAQFLAMLLRDIADDSAGNHWEYEEFRKTISAGGCAAILALLRANTAQVVEIIFELRALGALERVLSRLDDLALEEIFADIARAAGVEGPPLSVADVVWAAQWSFAHPPVRGWTLDSRRQALRLFAAARAAGGERRTPRRILHALMALLILLESSDAATLLLGNPPASARAVPPSGTWRPAEVLAFFESLRHQPPRPASRPDESAAALLALLDNVRPLVPSAAIPPKRAAASKPWIESEVAGVFLIAGLLLEREWDRISLAGLALSVLGRFDPSIETLDPAVGLFAGFTGVPDMAALRAAFRQPGRAQELDRMAANLVREFGRRIRGFRKSPRDAIVCRFLAHPGRIRVEEDRLFVRLAPNPFHVALHLSGTDSAIDGVPWLGGKRIEFYLEGL